MTGWPLVILILGGAYLLVLVCVGIYAIEERFAVRRRMNKELVSSVIRRAIEEHDAAQERFEHERERMNRDFEQFRDGIRGDRQWRGKA